MTNQELTALLGGWEGYRLEAADRLEPDEEQGRSEPQLWLELVPCSSTAMRCSGCRETVTAVHDVTERRVAISRTVKRCCDFF